MPISQRGIWAPRRIQYCTRSHLNPENLPRLRPELLYSKNLGEGVQRRVFHNQARPQRAQITRVCMVTTVNICKVIFLTTGLNHLLDCAALI